MFRFILSLIGLFGCLQASAQTTSSPNVIVILTDDQGWGDLSLHGNPVLRTPHLDSLAKKGAQFDRFFVQPVCSPTRAEFLTGRYHPRGGVRDVSTGGERLNLDETTIAQAFRAANYKTAVLGKWHNGSQYPYHPNGRGFQEFYGFTSGHWGHYFDPPLEHNGKAIQGKGYITEDLTNRVIDFIKENAKTPFFCYLAYNTPHSPMQVPDENWDRIKMPVPQRPTALDKKEDRQHTRAALAMCENVDDHVGRLLKALDDQKLTERTIVVYFCDNGPNGIRWNGEMKGRKGSTDEGGVRSPLFIRWPGQIPAGTFVKPIAGAIDLYPTLTELAGVKRVGDKPLDGTSFAATLLGKSQAIPERTLFQHWNGRVSARTQTHRLDAEGKLFDMVKDPSQKTDIAAQNPELTTTLKEQVTVWKKDVLSGIAAKENRPFPVGHADFAITTLPARDGVPQGTVTRSARAPNCSYFTNWTQTTDQITWDVEVLTAGTYRVEILYTCAQENLGTVVSFRLGDTEKSRKVTELHDPKAYGAEKDRASRGSESLVKDFKPLDWGEVQLVKGRASLQLKATEIPGKQSIEVRSVVLTRVP